MKIQNEVEEQFIGGGEIRESERSSSRLSPKRYCFMKIRVCMSQKRQPANQNEDKLSSSKGKKKERKERELDLS